MKSIRPELLFLPLRTKLQPHEAFWQKKRRGSVPHCTDFRGHARDMIRCLHIERVASWHCVHQSCINKPTFTVPHAERVRISTLPGLSK